MQGVVLLSEIHPLGTRFFDPLWQARTWFDLPDPRAVQAAAHHGRIDFAEAIGLIRDAAAERGSMLVLRDWSHLDFTGVPFVAEPAYRLLLAERLAARFDLLQLCTVRHPLDQWQSVRKLAVVQGRLSLDAFLRGYRRFAEQAATIGFVRYEDFLEDPRRAMAAICAQLAIPFDPTFIGKWPDYDRITGDTGPGTRRRTIEARTVRPGTEGPRAQIAANADARAAAELLGYQDLLS
jgi:hypothetical protein